MPTTMCLAGHDGITGASVTVSGGVVTATFSVTKACGQTTVSLATYEMPAATYSLPQQVFDSATGLYTTGGPYTLTARLPDCYWQLDLVVGPVLPQVDKDHLYRKRKAIGQLGGSAPCTPPTTTGTTTTGTTSTTTTGTTSTTTTGTTSTTTTGTTSTTTGTTTGTTTTGTTTTGTTTTGTTQTTTTGTTSTTTTTGSTTNATQTTTSGTTQTGTTTTPAPFLPPSVVDVSVTKGVHPASASVGQQVTYTLTVHNSGPATAQAVTLVDPMPARETFVSVDDPACKGGSAVTCSFGSLAPGAHRTIHVVALGRSAGKATNIATVSTNSPETDTTNNQAQATVTFAGPFKPPLLCARLTVHKHVLVSDKTTTLLVHVTRRKAPVRNARLQVRGAGVHSTARTGARGSARLHLHPKTAGAIRLRVIQRSSCPAGAYLRVRGPFRPPTFTG